MMSSKEIPTISVEVEHKRGKRRVGLRTRILLALLLVLVAWPTAGAAQQITTDTVLRKAVYVRGSMRGAERVASEVVDSLPSGRLRERAVISRGLLRKALTETLQLEALVATLASSDLPGTPVLRDTVCVAVPGGGVVPCPVVVPPPPPDAVTPAPPAPAPAPAPTPAPAPAPPAPGASNAELPRVYLDTRMPVGIRDTIRVTAGGDVQAAITAAAAKQSAVVLLAPGAYPGRFTLPARTGSGWIVIRSAGAIPAEGTRVTPESARNFARLVGGYARTLYAPPGARNYRLVGLEITTALSDSSAQRQVEFDEGSSNMVIDRSYVHGHPDLAAVRCILLNADSAAVVDSYVSECHTKGFDSQAISSYKSLGPLKIVNNFLSGAGETLYIGGSSPTTRGEGVTADIEIRGNHITKDPAWFTSDRWTVKNLLELKFGKRVLIEGNVLEHNWVDGQDGDAINIKDLTSYPTAVTQDITLRNNVLRYSDGGIQIANVSRITLENNLIEKLKYYKGAGKTFSLSSGVRNLVLRRNTVRDVNGASLLSCTGAQNPGLVVEGNAFEQGRYGWKCGPTSEGQPSLNGFFLPYTWQDNALIAGFPDRARSRYPAGTAVVGTWAEVLSGRGADLSQLPK